MSMKKTLQAFLLCLSLFAAPRVFAQDRTIDGKVLDSRTGNGLAGVSVTASSSKRGTQTGADGSFKINVTAADKSLLISSIGFVAQEISIQETAPIVVRLVFSESTMGEVVVVGYGTQRRKELTGSIAKVTSDKIANVPAPSFESALAGKAAGVQVITSGGAAGSGAIIRIRGISSVSVPGDPLYVIDGLPIDATYLNTNTRNRLGQDRNPLANINPDDIESIEILKDAGAAGIYGSRGANGVVLVTTKKGKGNKLRVNYDARTGINTYAVKPKYVDKNTWLALRQEAWELDGNTGLQQGLPGKQGGFPLSQALNSPGTDWWDLATRTGYSQSHNLAVSKNFGKLALYGSTNFSQNRSYIVGNDFTRYGVLVNADYKITNDLTISGKVQLNQARYNLLNNAWNGGLGLAMSTGLPYYPVFNPDSSYFRTDGFGTTWDFNSGNNLVAQRDNASYRSDEGRQIYSTSLTYKGIKNLTLSVSGQYEQSNNYWYGYRNAFILNRLPSNTFGLAEENHDRYTNYWLNSTLSYNLEINKDHRLNILAGAEYQDQQTENKYVDVQAAEGPIYDGGKNNEYDSLKAARMFNTNFQKRFQSFMGRVNYSFKSRYIAQFSIRRDASSVFRGNNRFAYFPTASAAWIISDESFMAGVKGTLSFLKLRASWGQTGSSNIPWNAGYPSVTLQGPTYNGVVSIVRNNLGNPNLRWETTNNYDLALEYGFLKNKITGEIGVYRKRTSDLLLEVPVNLYNGIGGTQWQNQGLVVNEGIEFSINTTNIQKRHFSWTTSLNLSHNYNEVINIGSLLPDAIGGGTNETRIVPGYPIGTIFTVRYLGVDPADGLPIYLDRNGKQTKVLNVNSVGGDKVPVGSNLPDLIGGLTNTFRYKDFELSSLFTFQKGGKIWDNSGKRSMGFITDWQIYSFYVGNYWRKPGDVAKYPRPTLRGYPGVEGNPWSNNSSIQVFDADFLRLKELTLSYHLPKEFMRKLKMASGKVFFSGYNLLLFTEYPVGDPEGGRDGENDAARNQSPNANFLNLPQQKSFTVGFNLSF
ncbi:MAG: SusC/RagA family TonB-linked outer membrane protein [Bacteroidota bacterium]|jgi:TonB-linked SusC/RagA family outer membrane protein